ncbi:histidine phosphatase family protein [Marinobacterium iners]|uniref:Histidine phosphatase superfamily (Branch 1) n=1 Tax=Marinobacterium iners DSM 11526 TaxID=1122198 RepID=A0A1H4BW44_9GAMM|nr:histidine phosphatase family protein [Marinobacterium iners]SEA52361.1 Histidine phosphatase superfamily (branch 1) [Marinobacterium iners DSM 11526]
MALYFIRHAQTLGNAANVWVGRKDESITAAGIVALNNTAEKLSAIEFNHIYTSPLQRASETAAAIAQTQRLKLEPKVRIGLQERDFGVFEGKAKTSEHRNSLDQDASVELHTSMCERLYPVMKEVAALQGNTLLVSHSAVFKCLVEHMGYVAKPEKISLNNLEYVQLIGQVAR